MKGLLVLLLMVAARPVAALQTDSSTALSPYLRELIQRTEAQATIELAKSHLGGATIGVVSGDRLVWTKSYGWADRSNQIPASDGTNYRIGSATKQFTALMLLQLVQRGAIHLSDPVKQYLPEVERLRGRQAGTAPITLMELATHTAGVAAEPHHADAYLAGPVSDWEKVLVAALSETDCEFEPGTHYSYSNMGYAILGAALGRAAGEPYVSYVREHIFEPLGMKDTDFEPNPAMHDRIATGYLLEEGKLDSLTSAREHRGRGYKVPN
jgi:CubicO group peptidase (beta-lactamase class C family)